MEDKKIQKQKLQKFFRGFALSIFLLFLVTVLIYFIIVAPHVDSEIDVFKKGIKDISDPEIKIKEIANFTESEYYQAYGQTPNFSYFGFETFNDTKIRIRPRLLFANDPYFISYFKTGACGESAVLLNFVANKSGFESRIVGSKAEDHQWNELKMNDRWVQVDPTIYYYYYTDPETYPTYKDLWFDNPQAYSNIGWYEGGYSSVTVIGTNEDLSTKYCNTSRLSIFCQGCDHIKIIPVGRRIAIDQDMHDEITYNLGKMNYTILADKTIIPYLLVNEKNVTISLSDDQRANISSSPEEIKPTIYTQFLFVIGVIGAFIVVIFFFIQMGIESFKKWKSKRIEKTSGTSEINEQHDENN